MSSGNCLKRFLHNYPNLVDFSSASLIICLCLIVLLPQVHESFLPQIDDDNDGNHAHHDHNDTALTTQTTTGAHLLPTGQQQHHQHHEHHHDTFPTGEVIICLGFFVFYCLGSKLCNNINPREIGLNASERKASTVCCSSTRCPSGQREMLLPEANEVEAKIFKADQLMNQLSVNNQRIAAAAGGGGGLPKALEGSPLIREEIDDQDVDCVLLLNRHHQHHTHVKHHEHQAHATTSFQATINANQSGKRSDYGSTAKNIDEGIIIDATSEVPETQMAYIEEIRITRLNGDLAANNNNDYLSWPLTVKVTLFALILATVLIVFDLNVHGLVKAIKVFRAAATGALLYVAFFLVLPRDPAGCNSCTNEEV